MPYFGFHISIAGGIALAPERAQRLGCDVMQIFSRNQRTWKSSPLSDEEACAFKEHCKTFRIRGVSVHSSYLINPGSHKKEIRKKSQQAFREELGRTSALAIPYYTIHPGSHGGAGEEVCLQRIAEMLDWVLEHEPAKGVRILLETTAGQGTSVGHRFEHLRDILAHTRYRQRIGVCFDTCHVFAAGYDIRTRASLRKVLAEFDTIIGIDTLYLFHLNDSKRALGSRIDRHEHIGKGEIGEAGFAALVRHPRFRSFPMILETPGNGKHDRRNLALLKRLCR
jgi:deoxyribonuclease-4